MVVDDDAGTGRRVGERRVQHIDARDAEGGGRVPIDVVAPRARSTRTAAVHGCLVAVLGAIGAVLRTARPTMIDAGLVGVSRPVVAIREGPRDPLHLQ